MINLRREGSVGGSYDATELTQETMANSVCRGRFGLYRTAVLNEAYDQIMNNTDKYFWREGLFFLTTAGSRVGIRDHAI